MTPETKAAQRPDIEAMLEWADNDTSLYRFNVRDLCLYNKRLEQALRDVLANFPRVCICTERPPYTCPGCRIERIIRESGVPIEPKGKS